MQGLSHGDNAIDANPITPAQAAALFAPLRRHRHLALAISGGGDSLALMHLLAEWAASLSNPPSLHVLSVDHGLHPSSAAVARAVCRQAASLRLPCTILHWQGEKPATGIEQAARRARYALLGAWCQQHDAALVTAHTLEDQAETLLMRLARGAGVDGLSAMAHEGTVPGMHPPVPLLRPLLQMPRARLRATLRARNITWHEDPANTDARFERVRMRHLLPLLAEHGLTPQAIATSARRLQRARQALQEQTDAFLRRHAHIQPLGWTQLPRATFERLPEEIQLRSLAHLLGRLGGQGCPLRDMAALERLLQWLHEGTGRARTLGGARLIRRKAALVITREPGRPGPPLPLTPDAPHGRWDERYHIEVERPSEPLQVVMLHQVVMPATGDVSLPTRPASVPAAAWHSQPAIVQDGQLLALPVPGWQVPHAPFASADATLLP